ncbi:hypothetical protein K0B96_06440 [Horticoccus luteus]|uniref:Uncharacterized protein n=1 Tax=Horticoccus luteus TaxID=2862869 RepID=A0A8F9TXW9_9BACT|nr:hypothetical protein [Horticoccus luteus]QYM80248.1 hypothetical protein K0B96_06440 [Horticoccus luteus]
MTSAEQLDLTFRPAQPEAIDASALVEFLRGKGWMTAREICEATRWNDRLVREMASASDVVISYPGSPGYKLLADCTAEEYHRYRVARRSQARDMLAKVIRTDRIYFRRAPVGL